MFARQAARRGGFTLVELAIVLVIVGLLIGGILAAQSMMETAKITSAVRQFQQFDIAVSNFKTKYNYLPGDAPHIGGDGDGKINCCGGAVDYLFQGEIEMFWYNLSLVENVNNGKIYDPWATGFLAIPDLSIPSA